ncbi:MAG: hypothetical protein ACFFCW_49515 [Candidatus Hodarchaeota archaeon]
MQNQHFSFEEFKALFQDSFDSQEELLTEYNSFLSTFEQLDQMPVPDLSYREKAMIFRRSWQGRPRESSLFLTFIGLFRRPAVTFVLGIALGFFLVSDIRNGQTDLPPKVSPDELLKIEHNKNTQIYKGKIIKELYPQFENPKIVVERADETSEPHRVLHGTLDDGEIYVVWNL